MVSLDRRFMSQVIYSCCSFCMLGLAIIIAILCFEIRDEHLGTLIEIDGAQLIGLDWTKTPFISHEIVSSKDDCPIEHPEPMVYDVWMGLIENCFCQDGSELEGTRGEGNCKGKAANSPYCRSRPAINPTLRTDIEGEKVCGKRGGSDFLSAVRPSGGSATSPYACPKGTKACGTGGE